MTLSVDQMIEVGVVVGVHGLRGDLKVRPLPTGEPALLGACQVLLVAADGSADPRRVVRVSRHKQHLLLRLERCEHIDAATSLVGCAVWMERSTVPPQDEESHYWHELEGLEVVDRQLGVIGRVAGMFTTAAHDILEVRGRYGDVLIPAIPPFICQIDTESGRLQVDLPEGLVDVPDERDPQ
ncbi:MAG: ribosome maturation factor RimM [Desulfuromonadales bacterium]|nr:ribosome maturation factor RimM [Desulfuromonadales bacterium]